MRVCVQQSRDSGDESYVMSFGVKLRVKVEALGAWGAHDLEAEILAIECARGSSPF